MLNWLTVIERYCKTHKPKSGNLTGEWRTSEEDISVPSGIVPKGARFKAFETKNFGYLVFESSTKLESGEKLQQRIYRY